LHVCNAKPAADERQALPVQPAVAVGQQVENIKCLAVFIACVRLFIALVLDAWL